MRREPVTWALWIVAAMGAFVAPRLQPAADPPARARAPTAVRGDPIRAGLEAQLPGLRACYEPQLRRDPRLRGRWRLALTVELDGSATEVVVEPLDQRAPDLERCVQERVESGWTFESPRVVRRVRRTLTFEPS